MSLNDQDNLIDNSEFSLESILAEYQDENPEDAPIRTPIEERSRSIVMEAISDTMNAAREAEPEISEELEPEPENSVESESEPELEAENEYEPETNPRWFSRYSHRNRMINGGNRVQQQTEKNDDDYSEYIGENSSKMPGNKYVWPQNAESEYYSGNEPISEYEECPLSDDERRDTEKEHAHTASDDGNERRVNKEKHRIRDILLPPIFSIAALIVAVYKTQAAKRPKEETEEEIPEVSVKKAGKLYSSQAKPLKGRATLAFCLCAVLAYISYAFGTKMPLLGALKGDIRTASLMCLIIELAVIITGLDVFTSGIMSITRMKPGIESLVSISCFISMVDAVIVAVKGDVSSGLPYCAVSSLSVAFAILGSRMFCDGMRTTLKTASLSKNPHALTSVDNVYNNDRGIVKTSTDLRGFVRCCEEPDIAENVYRTLTPIMIITSMLLAGIASIKSKSSFFHALSAMTAALASFSAFLAFPMPFASVSKRIMSSGAAIAGCSGSMSLGQNARLVIKDSDIFPTGTLAIENIRILEGTFTDKVISYTGSVIACSESALAHVFSELMSRNACLTYHVEEFSVHEGGGLVGLVKGEQVLVGTSGFMQLMGIRLPQKLSGSTAVFTAIGGNLVGVFNLIYTPTASVQDALVSLLQSKANPIFAIRDFNVTPLLIRQKFKMPTEGFDFPSFAKRYEISGVEPGESCEISAVVSREGLGPMAEAAEAGRRLYSATRLCTALSVLGSAVGVLLIFFLFFSGASGSYTVANIMSFMLFWVIPVLVISFGLKK